VILAGSGGRISLFFSSIFFASSSPSFIAFLKFLMPAPRSPPSFESFPAPKTMRMMTRMTINSGIPNPNMVLVS